MKKKRKLEKGKDVGMEGDDGPVVREKDVEMEGDDEPVVSEKDVEMEGVDQPGDVREPNKGRDIFETDPGLRWLKRQCKSLVCTLSFADAEM